MTKKSDIIKGLKIVKVTKNRNIEEFTKIGEDKGAITTMQCVTLN